MATRDDNSMGVAEKDVIGSSSGFGTLTVKEFFDLLLKVFTLGFSIFAFCYGARKANDFLRNYHLKHDATFSFYTNLDALIRRL